MCGEGGRCATDVTSRLGGRRVCVCLGGLEQGEVQAGKSFRKKIKSGVA